MPLTDLLKFSFVFGLSLSGSLAGEKTPEEKKPKGAKKEFVSLFDGKTLTGWKKDPVGNATYVVEDGAIVGTTVEGSPNTFLLSEKQYGDFELRFEVKVDDELNSGVQIRSRPRAEAAEVKGHNGKMKNSPKGRVFGPQVEIEASPGQAGCIYGEDTGLGWLSEEPRDPKYAHELMKNGEWNKFRVVARGKRIATFINGEKVTTLIHKEIYKSHPRGHLGLQVHSIKKGTGPFQVRWRKIRIHEFPAKEPGAEKKKTTAAE